MKAILFALLVGLLMVGCGEQAQKEAVEGESEEKVAQVEAKDDPSIPMAIPCEVCGKKVSKRSTSCPNCGHPTPASVFAYKEAQELERIRAEEERKRSEEARRLAAIRAGEERKRREEERKRREEERRLLAKDFEKKAISVAQKLGLDDHTFILNAVDYDDMGDNYTGWVKFTHDNGQIGSLCGVKDGELDGLTTEWWHNGQKRAESNRRDGKLMSAVHWKPNGEKCPVTNVQDGNGVSVSYRSDGTELIRRTYKDGKKVGLHTWWYENGQKAFDENWKDGKRDGLKTEWYENGQKKMEGSYKNGKQDGVWIRYNEDGTERSRQTYKDGERVRN
jgi:antitoxin component YwqK of YwqJK toxin-antitoxin module